MHRRYKLVFALLFFCQFAVALKSSKATDELNDAKFKELHRKLQTSSDEPWRQIPWKISLLDAQNVAAKSTKPIFIWAMDGHPLGCT